MMNEDEKYKTFEQCDEMMNENENCKTFEHVANWKKGSCVCTYHLVADKNEG